MTYLATPLFLDSSWAFLPALFLVLVLVIRTHLEDRTLLNELEGYGSTPAACATGCCRVSGDCARQGGWRRRGGRGKRT